MAVRYTSRDIAAGTRHEREHTKDPRVAKKIALDHLREHPTYYRVLPLAEQMMNLQENKKLPAPKHRRRPAPQSPPWMGLPPNWGGGPL